eukprot:TRINITY_DN29616_c0_g1_i1.p1 TRINITY_DN29616_c0_g1~~TRINITY_DN29616_c0_g1_i1.p1  ORF type:complete len:187 (-),score=33.29 TRINITY_DN29616_c0_g1_i1:2-562(-)
MWSIKMGVSFLDFLVTDGAKLCDWRQNRNTTFLTQRHADSRVDEAYGQAVDVADLNENREEWSNLFVAKRSATEGTHFTYVDNESVGNGLEGWRALHSKYDPRTGGRKKAMLNAWIRPNRATYENLAGILEKCKTLSTGCAKKTGQFGRRDQLPETIVMNAFEQLVPTELQNHILLNQARLQSYES